MVAKANGNVIGFIFALPPDSDQMIKLLQMKERFQLDPGHKAVFDLKPLAWLAKVGIEPAYMGMGIASSLYRTLLEQYPEWNLLTTTVKEPVENIPSANLQQKFGFVPVGLLPLGDRGSFESVLCQVHFRLGAG